jgi:hypothetical protein
MDGPCSTNGVKRRVRWEGGYWYESQRERDYWEDQDVGQWTILRWILERCDGVVWTGLVWLKMGQVESFCEFGNEPSGSIKCWETIEWLHNWWPPE